VNEKYPDDNISLSPEYLRKLICESANSTLSMTLMTTLIYVLMG